MNVTEICKGIERAIAQLETVSRELFAECEINSDMSGMFKVFLAVKEANTAIDTQRKSLGAFVEKLNKTVLPQALEDRGLDMLRVPDIGRSFYITKQYSATVLDKDMAFQWLNENGGEDLIQSTVNAGTLKSFIKSKIEEEGIDPPEDAIKFTSYDTIGSSKYTPK